MGWSKASNSGHDASLNHYCHHIRRFPLLTCKQERSLARRARQQDDEAVNQLVLANLRLVVHLAHAFGGKGLLLADLVAEGNVALVHAARKFDPERQVRFTTYAGFWIRNAMRRAIRQRNTIRIPEHWLSRLYHCQELEVRLRQRLGHPPTEQELGQLLEPAQRQLLRRCQRMLRLTALASLDQPGETPTPGEQLADPHANPPDATLERTDERRRLRQALRRLTGRQAEVLQLRFGLRGGPSLTLDQIGTRLGLTRQRVRQIEQTALARLGQVLRAADRPPLPSAV